ncbi:MAG TPA: hypothetical protein VJM84_01980 [Actinomycetota bacterium]|nr:hypothetical protein [Actinomycetota bacterium]
MHEPTPIPIHELPAAAEEAATAQAAPDDAAVSSIEQAIQVLIGLVTLGATATTSILRGGEQPAPASDNAALVTGAAAGFVIEGLRAAGAMLAAFEHTLVAPAASAAAVAADRPEIRELLEHWQRSWDAQRERSDPAASDALRQGVRRAADAVMDQLDVTELVLEHVDIQRIAERVDIDALVDRLDMDRLAARIDVDALAERVDIGAVLDRVDLAAIAADVIEQLDLPQLIREATTDTTSEGVRSVRLRGVDADRAVRRAVDRLLARRPDGDAHDDGHA